MPKLKWDIRVLEETGSTQELVKEAAHSDSSEGIVCHALRQKSGKGRHGKVWVSPEGNLYMSVLLRPDCAAECVGQISLLTGLAIRNAMKDLVYDPGFLKLKWPNDLLYDSKKLCGILAESELSSSGKIKWLIIGIGVNIKLAPLDTSICLNDISGKFFAPEVTRDIILKELEALYRLWQKEGFETIRQNWISGAHLRGTELTIHTGEKRLQGCFEDLNSDGYLILRDKEDNIRTISSGDVFL